MKFLFDFFPILLFFIAYKLYDIYVATATAIIASFLQVGVVWIQHRRVEKMHLITLLLIVVLGGATLLLHDETFIKWKPTVVNWAFAVTFLGSQFVSNKNLVQRMMDEHIKVTSEVVWKYLNLGWVTFFITMGLVNLYVAFHYDTNTWVNFKLFGMMGLTFLFVIIQGIYLSQYVVPDPDDETQTTRPLPPPDSHS